MEHSHRKHSHPDKKHYDHDVENSTHDQHKHHEVKSHAHMDAVEKAKKVRSNVTETTIHGHEKAHVKSKLEEGSHGGHHKEDAHHDHHAMMIEDFKKRFWVSLILSIPVNCF